MSQSEPSLRPRGFLQNSVLQYSALLILGLTIYWLGYRTVRTEFLQLISLLTIGFLLVFFLRRSTMPLKVLVVGGFLLRVFLVWMVPNLSDDVYRFIWDGQLIASGMDPYAFLPSELAASNRFPGGTGEELYLLLNSKDYFTVYPPMMQYIFYASAQLAGENILLNIMFLRSVILLSEAGILYLLYSASKQNRNILFYALNPAIILEFTGNIHFESLMLFLLIAAVWLFQSRKAVSGALYGAAAGVKLIPLIFGPAILLRQSVRDNLIFFGSALIIFLLMAFPLFTAEFIMGMRNSLGLYFQKFEFNASIYYLIREIGYWRFGYNDIAFIGPFLAWTAVMVILVLSWRMRRLSPWNMLTGFGIILTAYLFLSTTVHPWYIGTAVGLMALSRLNYGFVWSFAAMLSYAGYSEAGYELPAGWLVAEYILVLVFLLFDIKTVRSDHEI